MLGYSTREAARKLGLSMSTLNKYIGLKLIPLPPLTKVGGVRVRLWSEADLEKVRSILPEIANGRRSKHTKRKVKQSRKKSKP